MSVSDQSFGGTFRARASTGGSCSGRAAGGECRPEILLWRGPANCPRAACVPRASVAAPLLDLVVIAMVREQGLVGLLIRPVAHAACCRRSPTFLFAECAGGRKMISDCSSLRLRRS